ncbi:hypothetical protein ACMC56_06145 [Campylobacterota bacterium DY0563]
MGFFKSVMQFIAKASIPVYRFENNRLVFKVGSDNLYFYELDDYDIKTRHDPYVISAYTLTTKDIHLEFMKVDSDVHWNADCLSIYEDLIKEKLKIKRLEVLEERDIETYCFKTYKADNSFIFHIIYVYTSLSNLIVIDTKGKLYKELLIKLDSSYQYSFDNEEKGEVNFNLSLVKENSMRSYFAL